MRERDLRRRCRQLLKELDIRPPLDVAELCERVGRRRGRPIRLTAYPIPVPGPFGVWIATATTDHILYQRETSRSHQDHIVLHELGHILAEHHNDTEDDGLLSELCSAGSSESVFQQHNDVRPEAVRRALRRTSYDTEHERDAETVATIILQWASVLDWVADEPSAGTALRRMETALGDRLGWL
ncbi:MAG: hypothetical protein JOZ47_19505 [Kutzneria sp.]|nr:hypothetical protein [Kutzneria sp.]MBV9847231.1 hypothetical protein [Kutzneria sp.]